MANKPTFKDRRRDPNPKNPPPAAQVKEQKIRGRAGKDVPAKQPTKAAKKIPPQKKVENRKVGGGKTEAKRTPVNPLLRVTDTQSGTIHDEARRQKLRATEETSPVEVVTVEGNKVEVVARPERLAPEELPAHKRDTVLKDRLRESDSHEETLIADGVSVTHLTDWREYAREAERASPQGKAVSGPLKKGK